MEWVFGNITSYFTFLDFKKNLKVGRSPVGKMCAVCALLRNAITCLYCSSTGSCSTTHSSGIFSSLKDYSVYFKTFSERDQAATSQIHQLSTHFSGIAKSIDNYN